MDDYEDIDDVLADAYEAHPSLLDAEMEVGEPEELENEDEAEEERMDTEQFSPYNRYLEKLIQLCPRLKDLSLESYSISSETGMPHLFMKVTGTNLFAVQ